jgi:membrane protease YdiL (CAAX protease family)
MIRAGGSSYLALLLCIPLILVPVEVGCLLFEKRKCGLGWSSIIVSRESAHMSVFSVLPIVAALYALSILGSVIVAPFRSTILRTATHWMPSWAIVDGFPMGISPGTLWLGLVLSGLVAPIVEELYFRGFLMPRIPIAGAWAPAVNAALFSIYHFFSPWNYAAIFVAFLPLAYYVRLSGKLVPAIITHCLFNSVGIVVALVRIL